MKRNLLGCALAALVLVPARAHAGTWSKNWEFSVPVTSRQQAEGLKPGTNLAMSCAKCKTVRVMDVDKTAGSSPGSRRKPSTSVSGAAAHGSM